MTISLDGSVVVVTGASGGLGSGLCRELAFYGARLALVARRRGPLEELAESLRRRGAEAIVVPADVTDAEQRRNMIEQVEQHLGPIDILVNNAGIGKAGAFVEEDPHQILDVNLVAPIALTREVIGGMVARGRGHVLNVASLAAIGLPHIVNYSATKAGLIAFSTGLREELRGTGVSTTVVLPGFIVDSGIYEAYQTPVPWYVGSNKPAVISRKVVAALRADRPEAIVNKLPSRVMLVLKTISERAFRAVTGALGLNRYMATVAEEQKGYDGSANI